ncbi:acyltransferase [Prevotella sp. P6B1]|uniref:acyltransferase family protein n=1 Tax=Prevotella sp. P6B1 TaxID=1410613 RepID=UPI00051BE5DC|nr:acyltransferase [Prevotella sp. P6B1]
MQTSRIEYFDIAKGWAIFSVIVYHVAAIHGNEEIRSFINTYFLSLFFFISGFFSIGKSFNDLPIKEYLLKQAKHLLIPFFFVGCLYNLYQNLLSGTPPGFTFVFQDPKGGYWFLFVLFLFIISLLLLKKYINKGNLAKVLLILLLPFVVVVLLAKILNQDIIYFFSLASFRRYYLIFASGVLLKLFGNGRSIVDGKLSIIISVGYLLLGTYYILYIKDVASNLDFIIWFVTNLAGCVFWLVISNRLKMTVGGAFLNRIGQCSLGIYVVHYFLYRIYYEAHKYVELNEVQSLIMLFAISFLILVVSYYLVRAMEKTKWGSLLILGK